MSFVVVIVSAAAGLGAYFLHKGSAGKDRFELLYPSAHESEVRSSWSLAVDRLKDLGIKPKGKVRHVFQVGTHHMGDRWGIKKPGGGLVGARTESASTSSQLVRLYTDPAGWEQNDELQHEHGHAHLNMSSKYRTLPMSEQHAIMRAHGFPLC